MDFVVGHPRSGTQFLTHLLCAGDPETARWECMTLGERFGGIEGPYVSYAKTNHNLITGATDYYEGRCSAQDIRQLLRHLPYKIESNWKLAWILPPLLEEFPDAKILHLTRDPRKNVLACHNLEWYGRAMHTTEPNIPNHYRLFFTAIPYVRRDDWILLNPFERNCALWVETHRLILEHASRRKGAYLRVRQEDVKDPAVTESIFKFFGLPLPDRARLDEVLATQVNRKEGELDLVRRYAEPLPAYPEWPAPLLASFKRICGDMAAQLGYPLD